MPRPTDSNTFSSYTLSGDDDIDALLAPSWGKLIGPNITFSFPGLSASWDLTSGGSYAVQGPDNVFPITANGTFYTVGGVNYRGFSSSEQLAAINGLQAWSNVIPLKFNQISETPSDVGQIRFAVQDITSHTTAFAFGIPPSWSGAKSGDIFFDDVINNSANNWDRSSLGFSKGGFGYNSIQHELGHVLGLKHPFDGSPTLGVDYDSITYTVMSYTRPSRVYYPTTPMVLDIQAAQYLYGANNNFNTENNIYRFSDGQNYYETIWDAGGTDEIYYTGNGNVEIDLREGLYGSKLGADLGIAKNVFIAFNTDIENAQAGGGNDNLIGNELSNLLQGGDGDDSISGGAGDDTIDGGLGRDRVSFLDATRGITLAFTNGRVTINTELGVDTLINIEDLIASNFNDTIFGDSQNNKIYGAGGNDTINGGVGNDSLYGGGGNDVFQLSAGTDFFDGGAGIDSFNFSGLTSPVTINFSSNTLSYLNRNMRFINVEGLTLSPMSDRWTGGAAGEFIFAGAGDDVLDGMAGDDQIDGGMGNDSIRGGAGNDTIIAGLGNDTVDGGEGIDFFSLSSSSYGVNVNLNANNGTISSSVGFKTIRSFEQFEATAFQDNILGSSGSETIWAGGGDDNVQGFNGDDWINAGTGNDTIDGGAGLDTLDLSDVRGNQLISLVSGLSTSNSQTVRFTGIEGVIGGAGNDTLVGTIYSDRLDGGGGVNSLFGGVGNDILYLSTASGKNQSNLFQSTLNGGDGIDTLEIRSQGWAKLQKGKINADFGYVGDFDYLNQDYQYHEHPADMNESESTATLLSIEKFSGSSGDDSLYLDLSFSASIDSGSGNDIIIALPPNEQNDTPIALNIKAGEGDDAFAMIDPAIYRSGPFKAITIEGGEGTDTLYMMSQFNTNSTIFLGDSPAYISYLRDADTVLNVAYSGFENISVGPIENYNYGFPPLTTIYGDEKANVIKDLTWDSVDIPNIVATHSFAIKQVYAGGGDDIIFYKIGMRIDGGAGNDNIFIRNFIRYQISEELINGGQGEDTIKYYLGRYGYDTETNSTLVDLSNFISIENLVAQWDEQDSYESLEVKGNSFANKIETGPGDDSITGGYGNDLLYGGDGNDTFINVVGSDYIDGGKGIDTLTFADVNVNRRFILDIGLNMDLGPASASARKDQLYAINLENIIGGSGNDYFEGNSENNRFEGGGGNDTLYGAIGDDTLIGGAGNDEIYISIGFDSVDGGDGSDTLALRSLDQGIGIDLSIETQVFDSDIDLNSSLITGLKLVSIENLIGSSYADSFQGNSGNNQLFGEDGADVIDGAAGNDTLNGGAGNDTLSGGLGNDILDGGNGNDTVSFLKANHWVTIDLLKQTNQALGEGPDQLISIENVWGSLFSDSIKGSLVANYLFGASGNDTLIGLDGNDTLDGGEGNDSIDAGSGNDIIYATIEDTIDGGIGNDTVSFEKVTGYFSLTLTNSLASIETLYLSDNSNAYRDNQTGRVIYGLDGFDEIYGNGGDDTIYGGAGIDDIYGGDGNDVLHAGDGVIDYLNGGEGNDNIYIGTGENDITLGSGQDTIFIGVALNGFTRKTVTDFALEDKIAFSKGVFTKLVNISAQNIVVATNAVAIDSNDFIIYDKASGLLSYDKDGNGEAVAVVLMGLSNNLNITAANFMTYP
jgi:Ca2+-binding RTX toxin-like protein